MDISKKLQKYREKQGMTQEQVSLDIHCSRQTISNWETGKSLPDITSIVLLSTLYNVSLDELLKGEEQMIEHMEKELKKLKISNYTKNFNKKYVAFQSNYTNGWKLGLIEAIVLTIICLLIFFLGMYAIVNSLK